MKKIFTSILVAFTVVTFGQTSPVVSILDDSFLQSLKDIGVDSNNDGKIQESEAEAITKLNLKESSLPSKFIIDLTGIKSFKNLKTFEYSSVYVTKLDVSNMSNLTSLKFWGENLNELDISGLANLEVLEGSYNKVHTLTGIKDCKKLKELKGLGYSALTSLDVSGLDKLEVLSLRYQSDSDTYLKYGNFKELNIQGCTNLRELDIMGNKIIYLDASGLPNLKVLETSYNYPLQSVDLTGAKSLETLLLQYVQLKTLDVSDSPYLSKLQCSNSSLENIDLSNNKFLQELNLSNSKFQSLDVSMLKYLYKLDVQGNKDLKEVCVESLIRTINWNKSDYTEWKVCNDGVLTDLYSTTNVSKTIVKAYNLQGLEVPTNTTGELIILLYDNGQTERVFNF